MTDAAPETVETKPTADTPPPSATKPKKTRKTKVKTARKVKAKKPPKKAAAKKTTAKKTTAKKTTAKKTTAKKAAAKKKKASRKMRPKHGTKSDAIRVALEAHPKAGPTEVAAILAKQGVDAAISLISNVKHRLAAGGRNLRGRSSGKKVSEVVHGVTLDGLLLAKRFVDSFGGIEKAKHMLDTFEKLK